MLQFQSPISGLFPVLSTDNEVGSVRDSVYCAAAVWSLYQAYRRIDDDRGKSHELGQSAVKCMRGILECWIKQAYRVELFKQRQSNQHALHSKFHLHTGEEIYSDDLYNHLQIDVVSIYLIFLVQMITSGTVQNDFKKMINPNRNRALFCTFRPANNLYTGKRTYFEPMYGKRLFFSIYFS